MKADETKQVFLEMLGLADLDPAQPTIYLPPLLLDDLWTAFKQFAYLPLECKAQIFSFELYTEGANIVGVSFRRNFYIASEDDPEAYLPLCFEATLIYSLPEPHRYTATFFMIEFDESLDQTVTVYIEAVESQAYLTDFTALVPQEVYIFQ